MNISSDMFNRHNDITGKLKEKYDALAVSINKHLSSITSNRSSYPALMNDLKQHTKQCDSENVEKYKEIEELRALRSACFEGEKSNLKSI